MDRLRTRPQLPLSFLRLRHDSAAPFFAGLCFLGVLFVLGTVGKLAVELVRGTRDPHRHLFGKSGVEPLFDESLVFDVGISVFAEKPIDEEKWPECSALSEAEWFRDRFEESGEPESEEETWLRQVAAAYSQRLRGAAGPVGPLMWPSSCQILHVPETEELWSGIVANNLTIRNSSLTAEVDLDIPVEFLQPLGVGLSDEVWRKTLGWRFARTDTRQPNVYAVITLIPRLDDLRWTLWYRDHMNDLPFLGTRVLEEAQTRIGVLPEKDRRMDFSKETHVESSANARKVFLESLSIRVPLLEAAHTYYSETMPNEYHLANGIKAVLLRRTSHMDYTGFTEWGERVIREGCASPELPDRHRLLCKKQSYAGMGHWYAGYAFGKPMFKDGSDEEYEWADWEKRRYPPFFTAPKVGPLDYTAVTLGHEPSLHHSVQFSLTVIDEMRLGLLLNMKEPSRPGSRSSDTQHTHDRMKVSHAMLGIGPRLGVGLGIVLSTLAKGARYAATALTVLYWATRRTTTGISQSGLSFVVAGSILRHIAGTWDYYKYTLKSGVFWFVIWPILFLPALLQLRLLLPFVVETEKENGPGEPTALRIVQIPLTARERRSARLSPTWQQVAYCAAVLACAAYAVYFLPIRLIGASHTDVWHDNYDAMFPGTRAWKKQDYGYYFLFRKSKLLPLALAIVSAGQIAQLVMNYRSDTFAGNYALSCYLRAFSLIGLISPYLTGSSYFEGLYLSAVAQAGLVFAEAWQAWRYPRVEQEVEGEQMEL